MDIVSDRITGLSGAFCWNCKNPIFIKPNSEDHKKKLRVM
jgi:hypothetical protein